MHAGKGNFSFISFNDSIYCLFATKPTYPCTSVFAGQFSVQGALQSPICCETNKLSALFLASITF